MIDNNLTLPGWWCRPTGGIQCVLTSRGRKTEGRTDEDKSKKSHKVPAKNTDAKTYSTFAMTVSTNTHKNYTHYHLKAFKVCVFICVHVYIFIRVHTFCLDVCYVRVCVCFYLCDSSLTCWSLSNFEGMVEWMLSGWTENGCFISTDATLTPVDGVDVSVCVFVCVCLYDCRPADSLCVGSK